MTAKIDILHNRYERLFVTKPAGVSKQQKTLWECQCDCGGVVIVVGGSLKRGLTKSCGCLKKEKNRTHGKSYTRVYRTWVSMMSRCYNKKNDNYQNYGGRGIKVCTRWRKFENFYEDMGDRLGNREIDRINNNLGYCDSNCRWTTRKENNRNKRSSRYWFINGKRFDAVTDAALFFDVDHTTILYWCGRHHRNNYGPDPHCYSVKKY